MSPIIACDRFRRLIDLMLKRGYPTAVYFADERAPAGALSIDGPRLSVCLSASARYVVLRHGVRTELELKRGEAIYALPQSLMTSHPDARYLSFGLVFQPGLTRFLLAQKRPRQGREFSHRFVLTHHSPAALDTDGQAFLQALTRCAGQATDPDSADNPARYSRRLLELVLLKAQGFLSAGETATPAGGKARFTWQAACQFLQEHLEQPVGREDVARFLQLHPNHVSRLFSQFGGRSFHQHLLRARLERARRLLENPKLNIAEIARACGFTDPGYFIRCYRKTHGHPPGRARTG